MTRHGLRRACAAGTLVALCFAMTACADEEGDAPDAAPGAAPAAATQAAPGELISTEPLATLDAGQLTGYLRQQGFEPRAVRHGAEAFRIRYRTTGADGSPTIGSGVVAFPQGGPGAAELPVTTYLHGTNPTRAAASSVADGPDRAAALMFAGAGQATVAPDYPGLGSSDGLPAYMLTEPTVQATLDGVRALRTIAADRNHTLGPAVNVAGFSQGAQASMAVGRALREGADPRSAPGAIAAVAGPHDIFGTELPGALDGRVDPHEAVVYLAYFTTAWNRAYHLYDTPSQAFRAPYDRTTDALFDGSHTFPEIIAGLPGSPRELFRPEFLQTLSERRGPLAEAAAANDGRCAGWDPGVPVRLYHGTADKDVPFANSQVCLRQLTESGAHPELVDAGPLDHTGTAIASFPRIAEWFATIER